MKLRRRGWGEAGLVILSVSALGFVWLELAGLFVSEMARRLLDVLHAAPIANTPPCDTPYCDFSAFWPAGLLARRGDLEAIYDPAAFLAWRHLVLFPGAQELDWLYTPPALLPFMALSHLPLGLAYFVWSVTLALAGALLLRWAGLSWPVAAASLACPAALLTIEVGQSDIFCGAATIAGLLMADRAGLRAGALLGLLIFKPQAGLLAPLAVLLRGNWRAVCAGLGVVLASAGLVTALVGWRVWAVYERFSPVITRNSVTAAHPLGEAGGVSVLWMLHGAGLGLPLALGAQAVVTLLAAGLLWQAWRVPAFDRETKAALTACFSLLATPYGHIDDMMAFSIAITMLAARRGWRIGPLDALFWCWPALCTVAYRDTGILWTPVVVALAAWRIWRRGLSTPRKRPLP